ncbi:hypothetical protein AGMMS50267_07030 [Spirochaetia bacterium]|nr:hypothetical protein AGMMS50267_07000 [Spirochaetia bacterium]GHV88343.1 hypothetical protein AGMMS50267_07030 [Spirochaetia bacterium]
MHNRKKVMLGAMLLAVALTSLSALDFKTPGGGITPGNILVKAGFGTGTGSTGSLDLASAFSIGGNISAEYMLPWVALGVGIETGFNTFNNGTTVRGFSDPSDLYAGREVLDVGLGVLPVLLRIAYHPDFGIANLDIYAAGKIGYGIGFFLGGDAEKFQAEFNDASGADGGYAAQAPSGLAWGVNLGAAYYFTKNIGVFLEGGYQYQSLTFTFNEYSGYRNGSKWENTYAAYGTEYGKIGLAFKF